MRRRPYSIGILLLSRAILTSVGKVVAILAFGCTLAFSQDWARERLNKSSRHQEWNSVKSADRTVETFVVYPEVSYKTPVIIVIHDHQGMTEWPQSLADELTEAGG